MKTLMSMKKALFLANNAVGEIHPSGWRGGYIFYSPFDISEPDGATCCSTSLYYTDARVKRKIAVLTQALRFLGYNKNYCFEVESELYCTQQDIELKTSELLRKYNIGLTVDNACKEVLDSV